MITVESYSVNWKRSPQVDSDVTLVIHVRDGKRLIASLTKRGATRFSALY